MHKMKWSAGLQVCRSARQEDLKTRRLGNRKGGIHTLEALMAFIMVLGFVVFVMPSLRNGDSSAITRNYVLGSLSNLEKTGRLGELAVAENLSGLVAELNRTIAPPQKFTVGMSKLSTVSGMFYPRGWLPENSTHTGNVTLQRKVPRLSGSTWVLGFQYASQNVAKAMEIGGYFSSTGSIVNSSGSIVPSDNAACQMYNAASDYWWAHVPKEPGETYTNHTIYFEINSSSEDTDFVNFTIDLLERRDTYAQDTTCDYYNDPDLTVTATNQFILNDGTQISGTPQTIGAAPYRAPSYVNFTANASTLESASLELEYLDAASPIVYVNGNEVAYHAGSYSGKSETLDITSEIATGQNAILVKSENNATISYRLRLRDSVEFGAMPENRTINTVSYLVAGDKNTFQPTEIRVYVWR